MTLAKTKRGDTVFVVTYGHRRDEEARTHSAVVSSAGPKYITAGEGWNKTRFHRDTGVEVTKYAAKSFAYLSEDEYLAEKYSEGLRRKARARMQAAQLSDMDDSELESLIALLERAA